MYIYALSDKIANQVRLAKFEAYCSELEGDRVMAMNFLDLTDKGMQLIDDLETGVIAPDKAKILMEAHKNSRENFKLVAEILRMLPNEPRAEHAVRLLEAKPTLIVDNKKKAS